jgi:serine/threonine-protein kinase
MFPREPPRALAGFDILQRLGAGGAGEVFLAKSRAGQLVAIKTIADARLDSQGEEADKAVDSFAREAAVCVRLRHPCIVKVRAFLEEPAGEGPRQGTQGGFAALVFEYVPGVALTRVLRFCQAKGVRLPDRPAWHVVERVLTALAYAHGFLDENGQPTPIVHRDVSPSNVLLDWSGGVKIADFGIAKVLGVSPGTRYGIVKGTLGCMAPEQARGEPVDERADVYAAALLAWRLATGRVPFRKHSKDEFELLRAMRNPRIPSLAVLRPDLPEALLQGLGRALEPEREQRTISAGELAEIVRKTMNVSEGERDLAALLGGWRGALEKTVKRAVPDEAAPGDTSTSDSVSSQRAALTLRYEEVALAFDEDIPDDGPTFEAHALPSDDGPLASMPSVPVEPLPSAEVLPLEPREATPQEMPTQPPQRETPAHLEPDVPARFTPGRILALAAFLALGLAVGLLAVLSR